MAALSRVNDTRLDGDGLNLGDAGGDSELEDEDVVLLCLRFCLCVCARFCHTLPLCFCTGLDGADALALGVRLQGTFSSPSMIMGCDADRRCSLGVEPFVAFVGLVLVDAAAVAV